VVEKTHYDTLGIRAGATAADIRSAYRKLVLQVHPDRNPDPGALDQFLELQRAYEVLSDSPRKRAYDALLLQKKLDQKPRATAPKPAPKPPQPRTDFEAGPRITKPTDRSAEYVRLTNYLARGKVIDAEKLARKLIEEDARFPVPYAVLGDVHRFRGEFEKAAEMYAYAAQKSSVNSVYHKKHEQMIDALMKRERHPHYQSAPFSHSQQGSSAWMVGVFVLVCSLAYVVFAKENPVFPNVSLLSTWTLGLIGMLAIAGLAMGVVLAVSGELETFSAVHGAAHTQMSPSVLVGALALLNFWFALVVYFLLGTVQKSTNETTSKLLSATAVLTILFCGASAMTSHLNSFQTLFWGGNVLYLASLLGWMIYDGLRT
jgi:curved DNA-binding protein CbpA